MVARFSCLLLRFSWEKCLFLTLQYYCFLAKHILELWPGNAQNILWNPQSVLNNPQKTCDMFGSSWHSQDENDKSYMYIWDCDKLGQQSYCISTWILSQCVVNNQKCSRFCKLLLLSYRNSGAGIVLGLRTLFVLFVLVPPQRASSEPIWEMLQCTWP